MEYPQYTNYTFNQLCAEIEHSYKLTEHQRIFIEGEKAYLVRGTVLYVAKNGEECSCIGCAEAGLPIDVPEYVRKYVYHLDRYEEYEENRKI